MYGVSVLVRLERLCLAVSTLLCLCFLLDTQSVNICALLATFRCQIFRSKFRWWAVVKRVNVCSADDVVGRGLRGITGIEKEKMTGGRRKIMKMDEKWMNSERWWMRCASGQVRVKLSLCTPWMYIDHNSWFVQTVALLPYGLGGGRSALRAIPGLLLLAFVTCARVNFTFIFTELYRLYTTYK